MTLVYGQLESLNRIRETLDQKGITRFNSIGDLHKFTKNYEYEKEALFFRIEREVDLELDAHQEVRTGLQKNYDNLKISAEARLNNRIKSLYKKCESLRTSPAKNAIIELGNWYCLQFYLGIIFIIEKSYKNILWIQTYSQKNRLKATMKKVNAYTANRQSILSSRFDLSIKKLEYTKAVVDEINPLIAGAIGEHLVAKELETLSDAFVLFNDFSLSFSPPILNKKEKDRIYSIQIDHLLVTSAGIFIIETKNWSKESLERFDLRSPIKQIQRASFALFVILNSNKTKGIKLLKPHHWGNKKVPIRNVVAMINHKPKEEFTYVAVKTLNEINGYINHFEPLFDELEVKNIAEHLKRMKCKNGNRV